MAAPIFSLIFALLLAFFAFRGSSLETPEPVSADTPATEESADSPDSGGDAAEE